MYDDWNDFAEYFNAKLNIEAIDAIQEWRQWFGDEEIMLAAIRLWGRMEIVFPSTENLKIGVSEMLQSGEMELVREAAGVLVKLVEAKLAALGSPTT